jgi:hypothetical protein
VRRVGRGRVRGVVGGKGGAICERIEGRVAGLGTGDAATRGGEAEAVIVMRGGLFRRSGLLLPRRHSVPIWGCSRRSDGSETRRDGYKGEVEKVDCMGGDGKTGGSGRAKQAQSQHAEKNGKGDEKETWGK